MLAIDGGRQPAERGEQIAAVHSITSSADRTKGAAAPQQRLGEIVSIRAPVRGRTEAAGAPRRTLRFRRSLTGAQIETIRPVKAT
jgi:hypothetical protein